MKIEYLPVIVGILLGTPIGIRMELTPSGTAMMCGGITALLLWVGTVS